MATWFAAQAFWWAYRAGATISRAYLNWEAGRRGTTLEDAYRHAQFRRSRGQISKGEMDLVNFVMFNDKWKWTSSQDFLIDTSAFATAGLGLAAKVGLGNRILAVLGVKTAPTAGTVIDGMIEAVGAMFSAGEVRVPSVGDITQAVLEVLKGAQQTDVVKHGTNVVNATVKLGSLIQPFLGVPPQTLIPRAILSAPAIVGAAAQLFGSLLGLWGVVEETLPEPKPAVGTRGAPPLTDPVFRNALAAMEPPAPPPPVPEPTSIVVLPEWVGWRSMSQGPRPVGPDITFPALPILPVPAWPDAWRTGREMFVRRFTNFGGGSLRAVKGRETAGIFPFG